MMIGALDSGMISGSAVGATGGRPILKTIKLPQNESVGMVLSTFEGLIRKMIRESALERLYIELPFIQRDRDKLNVKRERLAWGYQAAAAMAGHKEGITCVGVESGAWRKHFLDGITRAPNTIASQNDRRKWLKQKAMDECLRRGWHAPNSDAAEAGGIWAWGCEDAMPESTLVYMPLFQQFPTLT